MSPTNTTTLVKAALDPFLQDTGSWTLHVPMFLNTFCLAYHLADHLHQGGLQRDDIDAKFVSDEWWRGHPTFMYRTDIEIFVAVESTILRLEKQGHDLRNKFRFTNYTQKYLFSRRSRAGAPGQLPLLITDIPPTVDIMMRSWKSKPPLWLQTYQVTNAAANLEKNVRPAWTRGVADLFDTTPKVYAFSAPMTQLLFAQSNGPSSKYETLEAGANPVPTYYVLRCNSGVPTSKVKSLIKALSDYYRIIFDKRLNTSIVDDGLATAYARSAMTTGQPNPFPEVYPGSQAQSPPNAGVLAALV